MTNDSDMVIFTQTYDLPTWLLPQCERFPKSQRFVVTQRLQGAALDFQEACSKPTRAVVPNDSCIFKPPTPA